LPGSFQRIHRRIWQAAESLSKSWKQPEIFMNWVMAGLRQTTRVAAGFLLALALAGCSPSVKDDAPLDIRGELISPVTPPEEETDLADASDSLAEDRVEVGPIPEDENELASSELAEPPLALTPESSSEAVPDQTLNFESVRLPGIKEDFLEVSFEALASFEFDVPDDPAAPAAENGSQIPAGIRALDQKRVALKGFMLPLKVEGGLVTELLLMRDQSMCCFGTVPRINEWVSVQMAPKGIRAIMDQPVTIFGKLHVGEMRENGYLVGIYKMEGQTMTGPLDM
jgi:hypothetical protein